MCFFGSEFGIVYRLLFLTNRQPLSPTFLSNGLEKMTAVYRSDFLFRFLVQWDVIISQLAGISKAKRR